jgi:hypothetical protein
MENSDAILGLDPEVVATILSTALTIVSIFIVVTVGYYLYHFIFEKKKKK